MTAAKLFWMFTSTWGSKSHLRALIFIGMSLSTAERQLIDTGFFMMYNKVSE